MARVWVRDINYNILAPANGRDRHWQEVPTTEPGVIHPQWRRSMSENMLMNFFQNPADAADKTTLAQYYESPIHSMLEKFLLRSDSIPWYDNDEDEHERARLNASRIRRARVALKTAIKVANSNPNLKPRTGNDQTPVVTMASLYTKKYETLTTDFDATTKEDVDLILDAMESFQRALKWICIPFLRFKSGVNPGGIARPTEADLEIHVSGDNNPLAMGLGRFSYEELVFYKPETDTNIPGTTPDQRWLLYLAARKFAMDKGFLDSRSVVDRVKEELVRELSEFTGLDAASISASIEPKLEYRPFGGGGNGYKCKRNSAGQKIGCEPGDPEDYCVNNGSSTCAT